MIRFKFRDRARIRNYSDNLPKCIMSLWHDTGTGN